MYSSSKVSPVTSVNFASDDSYEYPNAADGTLVVMVIKAKHLPNRRKLDKQSPYVVARIGTTAKKTEADFRAGQTPEWTTEMRFELSRERKPVLKIDVLDETKSDPTPIGNAEIDASVIFTNPDNRENGKYIYDKWYDLSLGGKRAGMIYLEMTFYPSAPVLPPKIPIQHSNVVVVNEEDYNPLKHSSRTSSPSKYKDLPCPPFKSSKESHYTPMTSSNSVADDVFVSSENSTTSKSSSVFSKKFLKNSATSSTTSNNREVFVSADSDNLKGKKKYASKFAKFTDKFQSKEPISTLWKGHETTTTTSPNGPKIFSSMNTRRSVSPISNYESTDLDQLQRDISESHILDYPETNHDLSEQYHHQSENNSPPAPPPHLIGSEASSTFETPKPKMSRSPQRKPPPPVSKDEKYSPSKTNFNFSNTTSIPFSADTIGVEEDDMPTQVYMLDQRVKSLSFPSEELGAVKINNDEIDPQYYAPTPTEHFNRSQRLQNGGVTKDDLKVDFRTSETGYLGNGNFSPSVFQRAVKHNWDESSDIDYNDFNKPDVPPKIPQGLTEMEYYLLEKDKYLRDIRGNRA